MCQGAENGEKIREDFRAFVDSVFQCSLPVLSAPLQPNANPASFSASPADIDGLECLKLD